MLLVHPAYAFEPLPDTLKPEPADTQDEADVAARDGYRWINLHSRGRLFLDAVSVDGTGSTGLQSRPQETDVRRGELILQGSLLRQMRFKFDVDLAGDSARIKDAYIRFTKGAFDVWGGQFNVVRSLINPADDEFMESPAIRSAFGRGKQFGVGISHGNSVWTVAAGAFDDGIVGSDALNTRTYAARLTFSPPLRDGYLLHFGAHASHRSRGRDAAPFTYSAASAFRLGDRHVRTSEHSAKDRLFGVEWAANIRSLSIESQCMKMQALLTSNSNSRQWYGGCYISGMWFVTGESRPYRSGVFSAVDVDDSVFDGGSGAWQLVTRYDTIDFNDDAYYGGEQARLTTGVNWHLSNAVRLSANYSKADIHGKLGDSTTVRGLGIRLHIEMAW